MNRASKRISESKITFTELMLPSHSNFGGKIHGGYLLQLMDQIAFASASKYSGKYCVTASVDTVDFLNPVEIGELVTLKASINYVGNSSMVVGIRVISQNIQTGETKHCNSSYFTMVAKNDNGEKAIVPLLEINTLEEVRRFYDNLRRINQRKHNKILEENFDHTSEQSIANLSNYNVKVLMK